MGGVLGGGGQAAYNASNGEAPGKNVFRSAAIGAMAFGGYKAMKDPGAFKNLGAIKEGTRLGKDIKNSNAFGVAKKFTTDIGKTAESTFRKSDMYKNLDKTKLMGGFTKNFAPGAIGSGVSGGIAGAAAGAIYGGFSSNESIVSGASKGLMIGAVGNAARRSFTKFNRGGSIRRARSNSANAPIGNNIETATGVSPNAGKVQRGGKYSTTKITKAGNDRFESINKVKNFVKSKRSVGDTPSKALGGISPNQRMANELG